MNHPPAMPRPRRPIIVKQVNRGPGCLSIAGGIVLAVLILAAIPAACGAFILIPLLSAPTQPANATNSMPANNAPLSNAAHNAIGNSPG